MDTNLKLRDLNSHTEAQAKLKRELFLENLTGKKLISLRNNLLSLENTKGNIENLIGEVQTPLGLAGPLNIVGEYANGKYYIPLATTEGALVASVNRGCKALHSVKTIILKDNQVRAPLFSTKSSADALNLQNYVKQRFSFLKKIGESSSSHLTIEKIDTFVLARYVWIRIEANTQEAMGMNMLTIASDLIAKEVSKSTGAVTESISGNLCCDKKPAAINKFLGRGKSVIAEGLIKNTDIKNILKTRPERIVRLNYLKNMLGSSMAGSLGQNAHHANIVAAVFLATGQDMAHVVEGSIGSTHTEIIDNDLYFSVTMPALQTAVVGGGTSLPSAQDCLRLLHLIKNGEAVKGSAKALAEIIAAATLAGELSLLSAQAEDHLVKAHKELGRDQDGKRSS